jgi:hypothetical protein
MRKIQYTDFPDTAAAGQRFTLSLPEGTKMLRAGVNPQSGKPGVWYTQLQAFQEESEETPAFAPFVRTFIVLVDGNEVEDGATHIGMWWEANRTFHLFELTGA